MHYELFIIFAPKKKNNVMKIKFNQRTYLYVAAIGFACIILQLGYYMLTSVTAKGDTQYVYIDKDDTQDSVIVKLSAVSRRQALWGLGMLMRHTDYADHIHTGRYALNGNVVQVFHRLKRGQQTSLNLTIPEVRTMDMLAGYLGRRLMMDSTTIAQSLCDSIVCSQWGYDTCTISALFVPNTYNVYWDMSLDELLKRMQRENENFWKGTRQEKADKMGMTPVEVCTLASIIDEETSNTAEKPMIAGMYLNRLKADMPLQADPTIKFALKQFELRRIYNKLLTTDSPYNTYKNTGLPPGPIKIASIKGIDAVLNHVRHDYLYMCAKEDFSGTHNFARTYQEHLKNAARYTAALNARGIQ